MTRLAGILFNSCFFCGFREKDLRSNEVKRTMQQKTHGKDLGTYDMGFL